MNVVVRYQAQLRRAAGVAAEGAALPGGATVVDLLRDLARRRPALAPLLLGEGGDKRPSLLVFVEDRHALGGQPLKDGDEVLLLTPIAGGAA